MIYGGSDVDGAGIVNHGHLTVMNAYIWGNTASNRGGGIYSTGVLTMTNSTLQGNSAVTGGGLINYGTATIMGSTLRENSASGSGGGIYNDSTVTMSNSTLWTTPPTLAAWISTAR
jgi:predicted outer membrane repeat protein